MLTSEEIKLKLIQELKSDVVKEVEKMDLTEDNYKLLRAMYTIARLAKNGVKE